MQPRLIPIVFYPEIVSENNHIAKDFVFCEKFENDICILMSEGYQFLSLKEIVKFRNEATNSDEKRICLVLWGGYIGQFENAFGIIARYNVHVDFIIATDLVGMGSYPGIDNFIPHFGWSQANQMKNSGLVDIYTFLHPFDKGKELEKVLLKKINLIKSNVPNSFPETAFCINADDEAFDLQTLKKLNIKLYLSPYYKNYTIENIKSGYTPYINISQEENILDTIDAFTCTTNTMLNKDKSIASSKGNVDIIAQSLNTESIMLRINNEPMIKNYLRHAFPLGVLASHRKDRAELVVLNNYIDIVFLPWLNCFDYDNHLYTCWPELSCNKISRECIRYANTSLPDIIISGLKSGYYSDVTLDSYYIPGKYGYNSQHFSHCALVYGFNSQKMIFKTLTYSQKGKYEFLNIAVTDFAKACDNEYADVVYLLKNNDRNIIKYDINFLKRKLIDYIGSVYEFGNDTKYHKYNKEQLVNFSACEFFPKYIENFAIKHQYIDTILLYSFLEHKRCMGWRINYIAQKENLKSIDYKSFEIYSRKMFEIVLNMSVKFNLIKECSTLKKIITYLNDINSLELKTLQKLVEEI